jgi:hypothetical protein
MLDAKYDKTDLSRKDYRESRSSADDEAAIVGTVLDYFEGWFQGDAIRMERALHPELAKRCLGGDRRWWGEAGGEATGPEALVTTTAREMINATAEGVGKERARVVDDLRIQVQVEDVYDTIAAATVRSAVYREYLHLVRTLEGWKIANALWQRV